MNKSSHEMENHVYQKAASREQYLALVARLILHVRDFNAQKEKEKKAGMGAQGMMPGGPLGGMPPGQPQPLQDPMNALQNLAMQGATGMPGPPQAGMMTAQQQQQQQMSLQAQRQQQQLLHQQMLHAGGRGAAAVAAAKKFPLQRQDAFLVTSPPQLQTVQSLPLAASATGMQQRQVQPGSIPIQQQQQQQQQQPFPQGPAQQQSTLPSSSPAHGHGSPMTSLAAPSPQGTNPSPAVKGTVTGAPSPSGILNTPGNPQVAQSPSGNVSAEEQAYLEKLNQLSKYIEPLRRMINKLERDEEHKKDYGHLDKMKNLLEVLSDSSKRMSMATLLKCEQVLERTDIPGTSGKTISSSLASSSTTHMCQPLINAVAENIKNPGINHALQRTFGPAVSALWGTPIRAPVLPKKRKREEEKKGSEVPDLLQGEIARLDHRFRVHLDPKFHKQSPAVHLVCNINDKRLPSVPPILVTVPEDYPLISPKCDASLRDYESTPFLKLVQGSLETSLSKMPNRFSVTTLLDTWEMSIRKACASVIAAVK